MKTYETSDREANFNKHTFNCDGKITLLKRQQV